MYLIKRLLYLNILIVITLFSCSIRGNLKGLYSYYDKTVAANQTILFIPDTTTNICNIKTSNTPTVYISNGVKLRECIRNKNVIFYIWAPNCHGNVCSSLNAVQEKCRLEHIELFVIAEYYDLNKMELLYNIERPIFGIDTKYYKSDLTTKYLSEFIYDLTLKKGVKGRYLYFKDGNFYNSFESLELISF